MTGPYPAIPLLVAAIGLGLCARSGVRGANPSPARAVAGWAAYVATGFAVFVFYALTAP